MTIDLLTLSQDNDHFFTSQSFERLERAASVASMLTALGVTPTKRQVQHSQQHNLFAAMLVLIADEYGKEFKLSTRDTTHLATSCPLGSGVLQWLSNAIEKGLLTKDGETYVFTDLLVEHTQPLTDEQVLAV